jgi:Na+/H+ antiporter NhaB
LIQWVLALPADQQPGMLFIANGLLSAISDNVFVATIHITEVKQAIISGHMSREHFETLAIAINTGTNLPSVATPNGQAAFLFLLTSAIAPLIRLSYGRMVWMALPYTVVMGVLGWYAVSYWLLIPATCGRGLVWRGGLPPLDCAAVPFFGAASRPNGGKPPRHTSPLPQVFCMSYRGRM